MDAPNADLRLARGLSSRHIQFIALGGAIGTGLFLGVAHTLELAGPSILLGYGIAGVIAFSIMRQLGEMIVAEPVAGSVSHFAHRYVGEFAGYLTGWNYWVLYILVSMAELSAIGVFVQFWLPRIPAWMSALFFFVLVTAVNFLNVKVFGEIEFWFSLFKVAIILGMIGFGAYLLATAGADSQSTVANLWRNGGFFPNGVAGLAMAMAAIMFSFGGLELVGITAAEAQEPSRTIPKAVNQVLWRILIFYVGALGVLLCLYPWQKVAQGGSPFVMIFHALDSQVAAHVLNAVILVAALSVYNSSAYGASRTLYGLAMQGNASRSLLRLAKNGVPSAAFALTALASAVCVLVNYALPGKAFGLLMGLVIAALVINWMVISVVHLRFRSAKQQAGENTAFRSIAYPWSNYACLLFLAGLVGVMFFTPGLQLSVYLMPVWLAILSLSYLLKRKRRADRASAAMPPPAH